MEVDVLLYQRSLKFRKIGRYTEIYPVDPVKTRKMKKREVPYSVFTYTDPTPQDKEQLEAALEDVKANIPSEVLQDLISDETLKKLEKEYQVECNVALWKFGLLKNAYKLHKEVEKELGDPYADGDVSPKLQRKIDKLMLSFIEKLARPETVPGLREKFKMYHFALNLRMFLGGEFKIVEDGEEEKDEAEAEVKMESDNSLEGAGGKLVEDDEEEKDEDEDEAEVKMESDDSLEGAGGKLG